MRRTPIARSSKPIARKRKEPRPGRLRGRAMEQLRREVFARDGYRCQHLLTSLGIHEGVEWFVKCLRPVTWESGHLAHIVSRGRGGKDEASNLLTKCPDCHIGIEHSYGKSGVKPCPVKP